MNPETEPVSRASNRQQVAYVTDVMIQMQRSRRIHFMTCLPKTAVQASGVRQTAELSLPTPFVQESGKKVEEWVILRTHLPCGGSSARPWVVRLSFPVEPLEEGNVQTAGGWPAFVADNRLKEGDYLIFLLKEDARSEFEVYMFRGPWGSPYFPKERQRSDSEEGDRACDSYEEENVFEYFPNEGERSEREEEENITNQTRLQSPVHQREEHNQALPEEEENITNQTRLQSPVHQQEEHNQAFPKEEENITNQTRLQSPVHQQEEQNQALPEEEENITNQTRLQSPVHQQEEHNQAHDQALPRDIREGNPAPLQPPENPRVHPAFSRRLTAYNIGRSDGSSNSGQFAFPQRFIRTHGEQVSDPVKLQGIHENSRIYAIACRHRSGDHPKVYLSAAEWSRFMHNNGLKEGDELQFSLVANSYFESTSLKYQQSEVVAVTRNSSNRSRQMAERWQHSCGTREDYFTRRKRGCLPTAATISEDNVVKSFERLAF